ncbi:MAG: hypothetical protein ACPGVU_24980 [Limisphaerales bacterium]
MGQGISLVIGQIAIIQSGESVGGSARRDLGYRLRQMPVRRFGELEKEEVVSIRYQNRFCPSRSTADRLQSFVQQPVLHERFGAATNELKMVTRAKAIPRCAWRRAAKQTNPA